MTRNGPTRHTHNIRISYSGETSKIKYFPRKYQVSTEDAKTDNRWEPRQANGLRVLQFQIYQRDSGTVEQNGGSPRMKQNAEKSTGSIRKI